MSRFRVLLFCWLLGVAGVGSTVADAVWAAAPVATPNPAASGARGPNDRFYSTGQQLDQGGSFYLYADTKDVLKQYMASLQRALGGPQAPPMFAVGVGLANRVVDQLGLYGIHDLGVSTIADGGLFRTKVFVSSPEGRAKGLLAVLGGDAHPIKMFDRAPKDTLLLVTEDLDAQTAWALVRQMVQDIGGAVATAAMDGQLAKMKNDTGLDVAAAIPSLSGEVTLLVAQNPAEKMTLPLRPMPGAPTFTFDSPRVCLMLRVKDDGLYQMLKQGLLKDYPAITEATEGKLRNLAVPVPQSSTWPITPAIATDGEYIYYATHVDYVKTLAAAAGPSLRESDEFKQLAVNMPTDGNGCTFVSQRLKKAVLDAWQATISNASAPAGAASGPGGAIVGLPNPAVGGLPGGALPGPSASASAEERMFSNVFRQLSQSALSGSLTVRVNRPDGVLLVSRSDWNGAQILPAAVIAPAGILVGIAVPGFIKARGKAQSNACYENLAKLEGATDNWAIDTGKKTGDKVTAADIVGPTLYLKSMPVCPQGGVYTLGAVGDSPSCSVHGTVPVR